MSSFDRHADIVCGLLRELGHGLTTQEVQQRLQAHKFDRSLQQTRAYCRELVRQGRAVRTTDHPERFMRA